MEKENREFLHTLPQEIMVEILLRLPVKSILRFKSVCKAWHSLISSPQFVKEQIDLANSPGNLRAWRCLYNNKTRSYKGMESIDCDARNRELLFGQSTMSSRSHYYILGSCNGLLLLMNREDRQLLCCWNPSTGKKHNLPRTPFSLRKNRPICGLCYDSSSSNDYKVVFATHKQINYDSIDIFVYTFRTNTWKQVKHNDFPYTFDRDQQGTTVNGAPHWVVLYKGKHDKYKAKAICYFDPAEEKFRELSLPCLQCNNERSFIELGVFGGCLSLTHNIGGGFRQFETWVMREKSWTKLFYIPTPDLMNLRPLCFTTNTDQVLVEVDRIRIVVYSLKDATDQIHVSSVGTSFTNYLGFGLSTYVESLAWPLMCTGSKRIHPNRKTQKEKEEYVQHIRDGVLI